MQQALSALESLLSAWQALKNGRPNEADFSAYGYVGLSYDSLNEQFEEWNASIDRLEKRGKWIDKALAKTADSVLSKWISEIAALVSQAQNNAVPWLLQTNFLERVVQVSQLIANIADRRAGVARQIAKDFEGKGLSELESILEAAPRVRKFSENLPELKALAESLAAAAEKAEEDKNRFAQLAQDLTSAANDGSEARAEIEQSATTVKALHSEIAQLRSEAERKGKELELKIEELAGNVNAAGKLVADATQRLSKVMTDARRQGLAGAFTTRGAKVFGERVGWAVVFVASVVGLTILSAMLARDVGSFTFEALTVALLRRLALAAPLVWLGWYSAVQLGRLGRIQEDYEYKAATALAFQSYRSEVQAVGVDELTQELLPRQLQLSGTTRSACIRLLKKMR